MRDFVFRPRFTIHNAYLRNLVFVSFTLFGWLLFWSMTLPRAQAAPAVIKFACVAPEGSLWVKLTRDWDRELKAKTQNQVKIQLFPGGILGEEKDVIRKIRAGQLHGTGVTGVAMGEIVPETRVLELPRLFRNFQELDAIVKELDSYFTAKFLERGFVFLGFTEVGPIHLFTRAPIRSVSDLSRQKMWQFEGDPVSEEILKTFQIPGVALSLLNVLPSLQTNVIDGVYGSPLGVMTMQWHSYLKNMSADPLAFGLGVMVLKKEMVESLPKDVQTTVIESGRKYTRQMVEQSRTANQVSVDLMKRQQIQVVTMQDSERTSMEQRAATVWKNLASRQYPAELLAKIQESLNRIRVMPAGVMR